jgi:hypothetical protein
MPVIFAATLFVLCLPRAAGPAPLQGGDQAPRYDKSTEVTLSGTVKSVQQIEEGRGWRGIGGTHIILETAQETIEVHLGPSTFLAEQKLTLAASDTVAIVGSRVKVSGADAVIAREIRKGTQTVTLRDENGIPKWSRGRRR